VSGRPLTVLIVIPVALALVGALHDNYNPQDSPSMRVYRLRLAKKR